MTDLPIVNFYGKPFPPDPNEGSRRDAALSPIVLRLELPDGRRHAVKAMTPENAVIALREWLDQEGIPYE